MLINIINLSINH